MDPNGLKIYLRPPENCPYLIFYKQEYFLLKLFFFIIRPTIQSEETLDLPVSQREMPHICKYLQKECWYNYSGNEDFIQSTVAFFLVPKTIVFNIRIYFLFI